MFRFASVFALVAALAPVAVHGNTVPPPPGTGAIGSTECAAPTEIINVMDGTTIFNLEDAFELPIPYSDLSFLNTVNPANPPALYYSITVSEACEVTIGVSTCEGATFDVTLRALETCAGPELAFAEENCSGSNTGIDAAFLDFVDTVDVASTTTYIIEVSPADLTNIPETGSLVLQGNVNGIPTGDCGGDPHFNRWQHETRDTFHGECDMIFFHQDAVEEDKDLDVQIRTTIRDAYSYVESVAMKYGDDVFEFEHDAFYHNGEKVEDEDAPLVFGGNNQIVPVDSAAAKKRRTFEARIQGKIFVEVHSTKHFMGVSVTGAPGALTGSSGILGDYTTGDMVGREGRMIDNFEEFGFEWQVSPSDPQLFLNAREPQLPYERCRMPSVSAESRRRKLRGQDRKLYEQAVDACTENNIPANVQICIDDVMFTGELDLAYAF